VCEVTEAEDIGDKQNNNINVSKLGKVSQRVHQQQLLCLIVLVLLN